VSARLTLAHRVATSELHKGTVTFLFTDIEGSTRLLKQLGERYSAVLADQRRILREAAEAHEGREIDTQGDSFFFAFARANAALGAAVVAQRALVEHDWPEGAEVRVRMGLHTGEPVVEEESYVGLGVHRAARLNLAYTASQISLFGIVVGVALLLAGIGFAILAIGGALRNPATALFFGYKRTKKAGVARIVPTA